MSISSIYKRCIDGVVCISSGSNGSMSTSTGFLIDNMHIVTCAHCIYSANGRLNPVIKVYIDIPRGCICDVDVVGADGTADIAVLRLKKQISGVSPLRWSNKSIDRGDQCVLIGAPHGDVQSVSSAYIRDTSFYGSSLLPTVMESILLDGSALGGNSGGPLFDMTGNVIGILSYGYNGLSGGTMNGAIPSTIASPIVSDIIRNRKNYSFGTLGIQVSPIYIDDALYLGMTRVQGYMVMSTSLSSLNIKDGDILTSIYINKKEYELGQMNSQHCIFNLIHLNAGITIILKLLRNGNEMSLSLKIPSSTSTVPQNGIL